MIETEIDVLRDVSRRLESAGISFMLTGSVAMNYYAQPRMTRDIDLMVSLNETQADAFFGLFEREYYLIGKPLLTPSPGVECLISFTMPQ